MNRCKWDQRALLLNNLLTYKVDLGGVDFFPHWSSTGSRKAVGLGALNTCHTTANQVNGPQVGGAGGRRGGGSHTWRAGGTGTAESSQCGLAWSSCRGGWCLSNHTGLSGWNGLTEFGVEFYNLEKRNECTDAFWLFYIQQTLEQIPV